MKILDKNEDKKLIKAFNDVAKLLIAIFISVALVLIPAILIKLFCL